MKRYRDFLNDFGSYRDFLRSYRDFLRSYRDFLRSYRDFLRSYRGNLLLCANLKVIGFTLYNPHKMRKGKKVKPLVVKEPNLFIEATNKLTKAEQVIWLFALTKIMFYRYGNPDKELTKEDIERIKEEKKKFEAFVHIDLNELRQRYPDYFEANDIAYYRKVLKKMEKKNLFEINIDDYITTMEELGFGYIVKGLKKIKEQEGIAYFGVSAISQIILTQKGSLIIVFSPEIAPILLELKKRYTLYDFEIILKLKSKYSRIFYRLFKEQLGLKQYQFEITVEELYRLMGLNASKMPISLFNRDILNPSLKEINEETPIKVKVEKLRRGRGGKIKAYRFFIEEIKALGLNRLLEDPQYLNDWLNKVLEELSQDLETTKEELAEFLLSLRRVKTATALWFLLHFPKNTRAYALRHLEITDNSPDIKFPDKFLEKLLIEKKEELNFLKDERIEPLLNKALEEMLKEKEAKENHQPQTSETLEEEDEELKKMLGL